MVRCDYEQGLFCFRLCGMVWYDCDYSMHVLLKCLNVITAFESVVTNSV